MKKYMSAVVLAFTLFVSGLVASSAKADSLIQGTIAGIRTLQSSSTNYATYHGYVVVGSTIYYFGGSNCSGYSEPSKEELVMLNAAVIGAQTITLNYLTHPTSTKPCIVGIYIQ